MHVAYIHQYFTTRKGSTGTRSYEMGQRLIGRGHRVSMICGALDVSDLGTAARQGVYEQVVDGIHTYCVAEPYSNKMGFARRLRVFGRFARAATRIVGGLDADLVFATSTPLSVGIPGMKGARRLRVPFVFEARDLWPELPIVMGFVKNPLLKWYSRRLERKIYFAADHIITLAPGIQDGVCRSGYPREKTSMIPNASDLDLFRPSDAPLDDPRFGQPNDFRLVFTGAHGRTNGLDSVLDAAAELKRRGVRGIRFIFIGDGIEKPALVARSRQEQLDGLISWVGRIPKEELARVLPSMDVGLMILKNVPSLYYCTSPNKFFDYIACGLPVLNNYPGWLADMIGEHECGRAVPPADPAAFADAVLWLRDHPDECRAMGRRARELAETRFSRDQLGDLFVRVLEEAHATAK